MARIAGVNIPTNKRVVISLTYIHGIGLRTSQDILKKVKVDESIRVKDLDEAKIKAIRELIDESHVVEGELRSYVRQNIKKLVDLGAYRGLRHRKGLPVRGQRTKTNATTRKGKRTAIAGKKK